MACSGGCLCGDLSADHGLLQRQRFWQCCVIGAEDGRVCAVEHRYARETSGTGG
jgi:hypothetical protein